MLRFCPSAWPREGDALPIKTCPPSRFAQINGKCDRVGLGKAIGGSGQVCTALGQAQIWMVQNPHLWEHYIPGDPGGLLVFCQSLKDTRAVIEYRAELLLEKAKKGKLWPG